MPEPPVLDDATRAPRVTGGGARSSSAGAWLPALLLVAAAQCESSGDAPSAPPCSVTHDEASTAARALQVIAPIGELRVPETGLVCTPGAGAACAATAQLCAVDVGEVGVGDVRAVDVELRATNPITIALQTATIEPGGCGGVYVQGEPRAAASAGDAVRVRVVVRPIAPGPCEATVLFTTDAANDDDGVLPLRVVADGVDGAADAGPCGPPNACCCADDDAFPLGCVDGRLGCPAGGALFFDERCVADAGGC